MIPEQAHLHALDCMRVYREHGIHAMYEHLQALKLSSSLELVAVLAAFQKENTKMAYTPKNKTIIVTNSGNASSHPTAEPVASYTPKNKTIVIAARPAPTAAPVSSVAAIIPVAPVAPAATPKEDKAWVNLREFGEGIIEVKACSYSPRLEKYILEVNIVGGTVLTSVKETVKRTALLNQYAGENVSFLLELKAKSFKNEKGERIEYMELFPVLDQVVDDLGELEDTEHTF